MLLVCSGLDHARRGYETFARECFAALRDSEGVALQLVKGSGAASCAERSVPTLRRDGRVALQAGRAFGFRPYRLEALSFAFSLLPILLRRRPDLVYLSEWDTAQALARLRRPLDLRFRILFCNGGFAERGFERFDHVQELTPAAKEHVVAMGAEGQRHTVLPLGFEITSELPPIEAEAQQALRRRLGLPVDRRIVVSVAALNRSHKRLDYVIDELAALPAPRPFALLLGAADEETPAVLQSAEQRLGAGGFMAQSVPAERVPDYLRASDAFVLGSVAEMQGRAVIEALAQGLPCFVHDSPIMRFAAGENAFFGDFTTPGELTRLLLELGSVEPPAARGARHRFVYERFSWDRLRPRYVELLSSVAEGGAPGSPP